MPAELLLDQLIDKTKEKDIMQTLLLAFDSVEKGWMQSIQDALAKKTILDIPEVGYKL